MNLNEQNGINLDYDYNTDYDDGDIPEIDIPHSSTINHDFPEEMPLKKSHKK